VDSALLVALASSAGLGLGALGAWLTSRRSASGRIGTSEAGVLWQQSQAMYAALTADRDRAAGQRDKLIEAQSSQVGPALAAITEALRVITDHLARIEDRLG